MHTACLQTRCCCCCCYSTLKTKQKQQNCCSFLNIALQAQQLWDALQSAQEALQHSNQLHELRTAALRALLKRQSRMALQPEAQALQWAVLAAWQRQTARQVRVGQ
jgi:hypothetical protein